MGSVRIEVAGGVVGTAKGKTFTVSDADVNRLVAWAQARFANGSTPTVLQALVAWADSVIARTRDDVLNYERAEALIAHQPPDFTAT
jgi:hypothetical protein